MDAFSNRIINGYELYERVGAGSSGVVYRAFQPSVRREVAIKIIQPQFANQPDFVRHFEVEAQLIARLEHPHIVPLFDYWRDPTGAFLVMRWLPNNLRAAIARGVWSPAVTARLLDQLAAALSIAHRDNVIHRDIKPDNVLLDEDGNGYLADFSIAKDLSLRPSTDALSDGMTGTPAYLSPEQIRNEALTPRTDIYSLGYVIYELLTGELAFPDATTPVDYMNRHLSVPLPLVSTRSPSVPAALDEVLQTATAKDPARRYANAARFASAFRAALPVSTPRAPQQPLADPLTERELDVLRFMVDGLTNEQISETLYLSPGTVKWYIKQIYSKLDAHSRHQAIERAQRLRLVEPNVVSLPPPAAASAVVAPARGKVEAPRAQEPVNPYKGLRAFQEADTADFFGRAGLVEQLLNRLSEHDEGARFLVVVGPSGSGKSSVVKAGLLPALRKGALASLPRPFLAEMLPGTHPLEELEAALLRVAVNPLPGLLDQLREDRRGLVRAAKRILPADLDTELFLIVDQFEEVFTLVADEAVRVHFIDNLLSAASDPRGRVRVILTLRADFYDRPLLYPRLAELVRSHSEIVLPLSARDVEQAIVAPAERVGVRLEAGLLATIVNDVSEQPGALPLLQYTLTELFERREGLTLTLDAYRASGGVLGALARRADDIYASLDADAQALARQVFLRLVTLGEGSEDTRRRVLVAELTALDEASEDVLDAFAQYRLLTLDHDPLTHTPTVEIAHEALIREWSMLREWLAASREDVRLQRSLAQSAAEWSAAGDASFLVSGARLAQLEAWAADTDLALTGEERAYLEASLAERTRLEALEQERQANERRLERRSRNGLRVLVVVLLLATLGAFGLSGFALSERDRAETNADQAEANFRHAEQQRLYLESNEAMDEGSSGNVGMALALRSLAYGYSAGADAALMRATRQGVIVRRLTGHANEVIDAQYSPDGTLIATSGNDGTRVYNAQTGELRFALPSEDSSNIGYALFHPSSTMLVTGRSRSVIQFWDTATGEEINRFTFDEGTDLIGFGRGGDSFITFQWPRSVREWDTTTGELLKATELPEDVYMFGTGQTASPTLFLYVNDEHVLTLQTIETAEVTCRIEAQFNSSGVYAAFLNPDDRILIYQHNDNDMRVVDTATCAETGVYTIHPGAVSWMIFSTDGETIYTSDTLGNIYHWEIQTGRVLHRYQGLNGAIYTIALSPDEQYLASVGFNSDAYLFDLTFPTEPRFYQTDLRETARIYFAPDGQSIVAGGTFNAARLDINTGEIMQHYTFEGGIRDFMFSPDQATFFASSADPIGPDDTATYLFDAVTGAEIRSYSGHTDTVNHVAYSPDGTRVASSSWDATARMWDAATGDPLIVYTEHTDVVAHIAFSPDNQTLLSTSGDGTARLWDADTGETLRVFDDGDNAIVLVGVFSPDGKLILTTNTDGFAYVWDVQTGEKLHALVGHKQAVWAGIFSPDGSMIATSGDGVRLWDTQTGALIRVLPPTNKGGETWPAFSPDGQWLAVGSMEDGQVLLWRLSFDDVIDAICAHSWLDITPEERMQYGIADDVSSCSQFGTSTD